MCRKVSLLTSKRERKKEKHTKHSSQEAKDLFHAFITNSRTTTTENTQHGGKYIIYLILSYSHTNDILLDEFEGFDAMVPSRDDFVARFHHVDFFFRARRRENTFSTTRLRSREHRCEVSRDTN